MFLRLAFIGFGIVAPVFGFGVGNASAKQLKWPNTTIRISISPSLSAPASGIKQQSDITGALIRALQRWEEATNVDFELVSTDISAISPPGLTGDGISLITIGQESENLLAFAKKRVNASAMTRVFFDKRDTITEADIALNPSQQFSTDGTPGTFDLESVFAHEIGHLIGLSHSLDPTSAMFEGVPRNGIEKADHGGSLSFDDLSKARALYGVSQVDSECCASIFGRVNTSGDTAGQQIVWLQDAKDGSLVQLVSPDSRGSFEFAGIPRGAYEITAQKTGNESDQFASAMRVSVVDMPSSVVIPGSRRSASFDLRFIGLGGQLSRRAINVFPGQSYRVIVAGPGIRQEELKFGTSSTGISIGNTGFSSPDFGKRYPSLMFDLAVSHAVRPGAYSIFGEDRNGSRRYLVGMIHVGQCSGC